MDGRAQDFFIFFLVMVSWHTINEGITLFGGNKGITLLVDISFWIQFNFKVDPFFELN